MVVQTIAAQLFLGLGAILAVLPLVFAAWICEKGEKRGRKGKESPSANKKPKRFY